MAARQCSHAEVLTVMPPNGLILDSDLFVLLLVLFGGYNGSAVSGTPGPARTNPGLSTIQPDRRPRAPARPWSTYDAATNQLLLFGGSRLIGTGGGFYGDTWIWTGRDWRRLHPASSPPARHNADMIYDAVTQSVVLFGAVHRPRRDCHRELHRARLDDDAHKLHVQRAQPAS
jgi:hypothetical protein